MLVNVTFHSDTRTLFGGQNTGRAKYLIPVPPPNFGLSLDISQVACAAIRNRYLRPSEADPQKQDAKSADYTFVEFCVFTEKTLLCTPRRNERYYARTIS